MGARQKLNSIYLSGAAIASCFVGLLFNSSAVFILCLGGILAALFHDGAWRPNPKQRR